MRRLRTSLLCLLAAGALLEGSASGEDEPGPRPSVAVRGIYGGVPQMLMENGRTLSESGVNAVWVGEGAITKERIEALRAQGARVLAEFNTLHRAEYLKEHPDAAPVGPGGEPAGAPHGWQGICPTHEAYRRWRMQAFRTLLADHDIDGVWLDYHHAHASWERAEPALPDTCFCGRCLESFQEDTKADLHGLTTKQAATRLLGPDREAWVSWRCQVFTDWVREFREIRDATRPKALLGTFHCPWSSEEHGDALRAKLGIDLRAQSRHIDVFSPMLYHARFGHAEDPQWISRQITWLDGHLDLERAGGRDVQIWPIVQLSDWGEPVPETQVAAVLEHGTRPPVTGVMVFAWGTLQKQPEKVEAMVRFYRAIGGARAPDGQASEPLELRFQPGEVGSRCAPRYSPKGSRVTLAAREPGAPAGHDALEGRLWLGPESSRGEGHLVVLSRSVEGRPFDRLWIDTDGDGSLEDEEMRSASPRVTRGKVYTSYSASVRVRHASGPAPAAESYPIGLWVAVDSEDATPAFVRYTRRGFLVASVSIGAAAYQVVLSDANNDAVYGEGDWWTVLPEAGDVTNDIAGARRVGDFAWVGRQAFQLQLEGTRGREGRLIAIDAGLTPEADARQRDVYFEDKHAARAEKPLPFRHDAEAAIEDARQRKVPCFLDFETVWCGPCKDMDRWGYTAKDVVAAAEGIVCVKVDGDEQKDLKEAYSVGAYPTGVLLGADGEEIARFVGYQTVAELVAFFAQARTAREPDK